MASPPPLPTPESIPGLSFAPEDDQLITRYLGPKIARQPLPAATTDFIHEADVYAVDPSTLCAEFPPSYSGIEESSKIWYFFTCPKAKNSRGSRKSRIVGENKGTWHSESRKDIFAGKDRLVGYRRSFSHRSSSGENSGWLMMEFGVGGNQEDGSVICKIYRTPRPSTHGSSARKKRKAKDPAAPSARGKKRKAEDEERSDSAAPSARVRRRLNFRSPPATLDDDFLKESQRQHSEAEERTPAFNPISFLAYGHALSTLNCYDTPVQGDWPIAPENSGSWTTADPLLSRMPVETRPEESASAGNCSFFLNNHAGFAPSCPDTTLLPTGATADWASPAASDQYGELSYGSCTSGMEFFASSPVTGFQQDASFYCSPNPSSAPTASPAASTLLRSCGTDWASPMLPLQGWRNSIC